MLSSILATPIALALLSADITLDGRAFRVPDGFTVEKVAGPPLVDRPIVADFDEKGRLYVSDSSGSNDPVQKQLAEKTHRVVRLEDTDGDGVFDKQTIFADKMMFPEGAMWRDGSLFVAAPPVIWKLTDTDDDGVCDKREVWHDGKTLTGCANDLHGPYNGPDGWIYWCKGAFAEQTIQWPGKPPMKSRAAHIFRARPDGTGVEPVMTGGMDNPVEIAWTPGGELIFTTTFLQHPGGGKRDGLIHGIYGGVYGKDHDVIDGAIRTGPDLMPVMTHLGPAAPSGLMRYESSVFGSDYKDNLFVAQFNMHKVSRHVMEAVGATFKTTDSDFLSTAEDRDFHPTDVLEDADGSILVLDTGGWYKLCCPTSQIGKPDVLGAIYRVRKAGASKVEDPRGLKLDWKGMKAEEVAKLLDDPRPAVRRRAVDRSANGYDTMTFVLDDIMLNSHSAESRRNAVWAASRISREAPSNVRGLGVLDRDEIVRQAAIHTSALYLDDTAIRIAIGSLVRIDSPQNARAIAEAMARCNTPSFGRDLSAALMKTSDDRILKHSLLHALISIDEVKIPWGYSLLGRPQWSRNLLIVEDQKRMVIRPERLASAFSSTNSELREVAEWIAERHPEYAPIVADYLRESLDRKPVDAEALKRLEGQFARFAKSGPVGDLLGSRMKEADAPREFRLMMLRAAAKSGRDDVPKAWNEGIILALKSDDPATVRQAVATARALSKEEKPNETLGPALMGVANAKGIDPGVKLDALSAAPGGKLDDATFAFVKGELDADAPISAKLAAADILAKSDLSADQRGDVAASLRTAGPLETGRLLAVFQGQKDEAVGRALLSALRESPALASLRAETITPILASYPDDVRKQAEPLYAAIAQNQADQKAKLESLLGKMTGGDIRRGQAVFNGSKAACTTCHAIGYLGGTIGPDLSSVGKIRVDRDLLESIVYPSASFVRSYEPMAVSTKAGQVHSGLVKKDSSDEVILVTGPDKEVRIPRSDVEEMRPGTVSVMPAGLDQQLSTQELADLLAFLRSRK